MPPASAGCTQSSSPATAQDRSACPTSRPPTRPTNTDRCSPPSHKSCASHQPPPCPCTSPSPPASAPQFFPAPVPLPQTPKASPLPPTPPFSASSLLL